MVMICGDVDGGVVLMIRALKKLVLVFCEMMVVVGMVRMLVIMMHRKHMSSSVPVHVTRHINLNNASDYDLV